MLTRVGVCAISASRSGGCGVIEIESSVSSTFAQNLRSWAAHAATLSVSCARVWAIPLIESLNGKSGDIAASVKKVSEMSLKSNSRLSGKSLRPADSTTSESPTAKESTSPAFESRPQNAASP